MTGRPDWSRLRDEDGMTLPEILVAITLGLIVMLAGYASLDGFSRNTAHQTRVTDANEQVRLTMDRVVRDLRSASVIVRAAGNDLVYAVPVTSTTNRVERLCVADGRLRSSTTTVTGTPSAPGTACSALTNVARLAAGTTTGFTYDGATSSATPATVKNVGLAVGMQAQTGSQVTTSTLRASAARRSSAPAFWTAADVIPECLSTSSSTATLDLAAGLPGAGSVTVTYTDQDGNTIPGTQAGTKLTVNGSTIAGVTTVVATITDSFGVSTILRRDIKCS